MHPNAFLRHNYKTIAAKSPLAPRRPQLPRAIIAAMAQPQSFKNHTRWDPPFHYFIIPMLLLNLAFAIYATIHAWPGFEHHHLWWIAMSVVFLVWAERGRGTAVHNQNRIIRLEEQLRLADLVAEEHLELVEALTMQQYIALRFASDAELSALAQRAVSENLTPKQIKENIITWRPDNHRV
jgi:hypothetical protein